MNRIAVLKTLERGAAVLRRAGMGNLVDRSRGRALRGLGRFTVDLDGVKLSGDTAMHSNYVREMAESGREGHQMRLFAEAVRPGGLVVDVGAYLGLLTLRAARLGAQVIAFEPNPRTLPFLEENIALNGAQDRVEVVPRAVAAEPGTRTFYLYEGGDTSSLHRQPGTRGEVQVECVVPDDVIGEREVDVIKIDVEGGEIEALAGLERAIRRSAQVKLFVECNPPALEAAGASERQLVERLEGMGLEVFTIDEAGGQLVPFTGVGSEPYVNLLATRG